MTVNKKQKKISPFFDIRTLKNITNANNSKVFDYQKTHRVKNYKIFIITTGIGQHIIDFKKHNFSTGTFMFITKNQVQSFDFKPGNIGYMISFSEDYITQSIKSQKELKKSWLFNYHFQKPNIQVVAKEQEYFMTITERIFLEFNRQDTNHEIIQTLLNLLILNSERIKEKEINNCPNQDYCDIFFKFKNFVENNINKTRNAKECANELNISYKHLNNICKIIINKTAKQFIDDFIILEAKRCLLSSNMTIKNISEHTGFDEATNFIKYFKKHINLSPAKFREKFSL